MYVESSVIGAMRVFKSSLVKKFVNVYIYCSKLGCCELINIALSVLDRIALSISLLLAVSQIQSFRQLSVCCCSS